MALREGRILGLWTGNAWQREILEEQRMKSEKMDYDELFIGTKGNEHRLMSNEWY